MRKQSEQTQVTHLERELAYYKKRYDQCIEMDVQIKSLTNSLKDARRCRYYLQSLTRMVAAVVKAIDAQMDLSPSRDRVRAIAELCNQLELANDSAKRFGLLKIEKPKKRGQ